MIKNRSIYLSLIFFFVILGQVYGYEGTVKYILLQLSNADKPIEIKHGQKFMVVLPANQSVGWEWKISEPLDKNALELINTEFIYPPASPTVTGVDCKQIFNFRALSKGQVKIHLGRYFRGINPPEKIEIFTIIIR